MDPGKLKDGNIYECTETLSVGRYEYQGKEHELHKFISFISKQTISLSDHQVWLFIKEESL